jgi:hypothetical protein
MHLTQSNPNTTSYHHHFFVDTSNFYRQLLDKDQNIHCMICCDADTGSASWTMLVTEEGDNHIPVELCATLFPGLLVLFFISHCEYFLWDMFRVIELMVCCHEGRGLKGGRSLCFSADLADSSTIFKTSNNTRFVHNRTYDRERMKNRSVWRGLKSVGSYFEFIDSSLVRSELDSSPRSFLS